MFRMSSYKAQSQNTNFPVYQLNVNDITRSDRNSGAALYFKTTSCCRKLKTAHHNCAIRWSSKIDSTYKFDQATYEGDNKIKLLCMKCSEKKSIISINVTSF